MPRKPQDTENVTVALPCDMLEVLDILCSRYDLNRSQIIKRSLKLWLSVEFSKDCSSFEILYEIFKEGQNGKINK